VVAAAGVAKYPVKVMKGPAPAGLLLLGMMAPNL
jgi:hypothetical protein